MLPCCNKEVTIKLKAVVNERKRDNFLDHFTVNPRKKAVKGKSANIHNQIGHLKGVKKNVELSGSGNFITITESSCQNGLVKSITVSLASPIVNFPAAKSAS